MTTIAYRDGIMASDTGASNNGWRVSVGAHKIRRIEIGDVVHLVGFAGWSSLGGPFFDWIEEGMHGKPPALEVRDDNATVMVATKLDGGVTLTIYDGNDGASHRIDAPFHVIGSGTPPALGAMHVGASAKDAVRAAMMVDPATFGSINVVSF